MAAYRFAIKYMGSCERHAIFNGLNQTRIRSDKGDSLPE